MNAVVVLSGICDTYTSTHRIARQNWLRRCLLRLRHQFRGPLCEAVEARHGIAFESHFAAAIAALEPLAADGLLRFGPRSFELTPVGRLLTRNVAMCFDAYLPAHTRDGTKHFSRAV